MQTPTPSLEKQRALQRSEKAKETSEIWEAVLAMHEVFVAAGQSGLPPVHVRRAQSYLMRAGIIGAGDLPDDALEEIANIGGSRAWTPEMGPVYVNETVYMPNGIFYIVTKPHIAQAGWEPGSEGGRTMFRVIRKEPSPQDEPLDFVWGEHVPYGAIRRDPVDGKYYTPIHEYGVTLYEPHYPHLVPSEYKETSKPTGGAEDIPDDGTTEVPGTHPRWADLPDGHPFAIGDYFTDYGKTYIALRVFNKQADWRPPVLNDNFYKVV